MNPEAVSVSRKDHIATAKFGSRRGHNEHIISIQDIRAHALAMHSEPHGIAAAQ